MESKEELQRKNTNDKPMRFPFDLIFNQIQRKKLVKGNNERFQVKQLFKGFERNNIKAEKKENDEQKNEKNGESKSKESNTEEKINLHEAEWKHVSEFMQKYGKKAESQTINLNNCSLTETDLKELGLHIPSLPDIEEIDLSWNNLIGGSINLLTPHLHNVIKLRVLCLSNCSLTPCDISALGETLEHIPYLEVLDLSWNSDVSGNLSKVAQRLSPLCKLKALNLTECDLQEIDGESLAQAFRKMAQLEVLDLSLNKRLGCIMNQLVVELKNCSSLKVLNLHSTGLQQDSIQYLSAIFQFWPNLRVLDLSSNKEAGGGFRETAARLTTFKNLEQLDIHQCCLSQEDVTSLTQVIPLLSSLEVLDISSNKRVGVSPEHLFSRLRFLQKLKSLVVSNCNLKEKSFAALAEATGYLLNLKILDLSWNKCVGGKLRLLFDTLISATDLQNLVLSSCNLVTQDLVVLASTAQAGHLENLQQLDIAYNDTIFDDGWTLFFESFHALKNIVELDVSLRPASQRSCGQWFPHLLSSLPKLHTLKELSMQRWLLSPAERQQLSHIIMNNNITIIYD
ncbi:hypothetical protein GDO86_010105 [Hymenochirus boettgeri]|uniref:Leucine rich repeat containing 31 n=1 Tax=Hymenochirus boettgeri TaxID=247094 RepID=A0A8T2JJ67_9PIPI|nr:hypothetical protein GDO86_010105 [Hymenochirus boettgeri]